ncbi:unnamed protein product [Somion occarium]|uniref:Uncharacterized protein n=1 Tax=Somion occarium TaxID=3059160 RepID=A0ABP1DGB5_9APHY
MPASSRYGRTTSSPPLSSAYSTTTANQQRLNVVTRLAIEGKATRGSEGKTDGAAIKMYLKLAIPLESVTPGATIPLFPEENVKILYSKVHPLNASSAPYNFSSTLDPLLHKAARALNLPGRLHQSYLSLFDSLLSSASSNSSSASPLDDKYTGLILVSGYQVSFVLPKEFPSRIGELTTRSPSSRRASNATNIQFVAAIDIWVPFLSKPPLSPYLCLHNYVKLRIFPPTTPAATSSSLASISSAEEEFNSWDLTSEPHVTQGTTPQKRSRSNSQSYMHFADDESSDSSTTGFPDGCGIQGTFQSAERIRIRWAKPMKSSDIPETADGRRRVGVREVDSNLTCTILGKHKIKGKRRNTSGDQNGIIMKLEYTATCHGVWFPGVATMLGMDVGLDAGDYDVSWAPDGDKKWSVSGSSGFTGFATGAPPSRRPSVSRQSSADTPSIFVLPSSPDGRATTTSRSQVPTRQTPSTSLLRAPLPAQNGDDYSFESSPNTTPISSIASLATIPSSPERDRRSRASSANGIVDTDSDEAASRPPTIPVTVHINMNELGPPSKNVFTFTISGTVVVSPRKVSLFLLNHSRVASPTPSASSSGDQSDDAEPVLLPQFRVLYSELETTAIVLQSNLEDAAVDVYNVKGSPANPQTRKTILQPGGQTKCSSEGARIALRALQPPPSTLRPYSSMHRSSRRGGDDSLEEQLGVNRSRVSNSMLSRNDSSSGLRQSYFPGASTRLKPKRDGPLMIPSVSATVTPLLTRVQGEGRDAVSLPTDYAVRLTLPAPSDADSEWLEFGLALPSDSSSSSTSSADAGPPKVEVASASVEGVPVKFEATAASKPEKLSADLDRLGVPFEQTSTREWLTWVKVRVGEAGGGNVQIVYIVRGMTGVGKEAPTQSWWKGKGRARSDDSALNVLLPTFSLPVGMLEVTLEGQAGFEITALRSNLTHEQLSSSGRRLSQYSLEEFFYPRLSVHFTPSSSAAFSYPSLWRGIHTAAIVLPAAAALVLLGNQNLLAAELAHTKQALYNCSNALPEDCHDLTETVTITATATIYTASSHSKWWHPGSDTSSLTELETSTSSVSVSLPHSTPSVTSIPTVTPSIPIIPSGSSALPPSETEALVLRSLPFSWPLKLDILSFDIPEPARTTVSYAFRGLGMAWQLVRKVIHYPLDPP